MLRTTVLSDENSTPAIAAHSMPRTAGVSFMARRCCWRCNRDQRR